MLKFSHPVSKTAVISLTLINLTTQDSWRDEQTWLTIQIHLDQKDLWSMSSSSYTKANSIYNIIVNKTCQKVYENKHRKKGNEIQIYIHLEDNSTQLQHLLYREYHDSLGMISLATHYTYMRCVLSESLLSSRQTDKQRDRDRHKDGQSQSQTETIP